MNRILFSLYTHNLLYSYLYKYGKYEFFKFFVGSGGGKINDKSTLKKIT